MATRDLEFSLSEALIDPDYTQPTNFPALVDHEPYERAQEPMLLFKPPVKSKQPAKSDKKSRRISMDVANLKGGGGIIAEFFGNKKRKADEIQKQSEGWSGGDGKLHRSRSFDTLHRRLKGWDNVFNTDEEATKGPAAPTPQTFVYKQPAKTDDIDTKNSPRLTRPKRDSQIFSEGVSIYEEPISLLKRDESKEAEQPSQEQQEPPTKAMPTEQVDMGQQEQPPSVPPASSSPRAPQKPARSKSRNSPSLTKKTISFTVQDIMTPPKSSSSSQQADAAKTTPTDTQDPSSTASANTSSAPLLNENMGLLRVKVLAVQLRQAKKKSANTVAELDSDDDFVDKDEKSAPTGAAAILPPTDGLFCTLSINGKQSRFESSLQPLKPKEQVAVWDHSETEAVFYATSQQKLFVASRKLPLKEHEENSSSILSLNAKAECFGVGIYSLANQTQQILTTEDGSIDNWAEETGTVKEVNIELEPKGEVLLGMSFLALNPNSKVTCNGSVTVQYLNGINSFRNEVPCWTCCTVDIDNDNFGTTSSIIGMDDFLNKGFPNDTISFAAYNSTTCKIQIWGFGDDDAEYLFGEAYVPLAAILPYSKHIVHQEDENKPLKLLGEADREIVLPIEPVGTIGLLFHVSSAPELADESIEQETIQMLEASGIFTPAAIAHFKQHTGSMERSVRIEEQQQLNSITPIPEESSSLDSATEAPPINPSSSISTRSRSTKKRFIPSRLSLKKKDIYESGEYDRLSPSPISSVPPSNPISPTHSISPTNPLYISPTNPILHSLTRSLKDKKQSLRLLGSIKLQVPTDYHEKKFQKFPENFDPYREIEIMKVEMRDIKAQLAEAQFHREKAEVKVKNLELEVENWKEKYSGKKKGRKYY